MPAWAQALRGELQQWPAVRITSSFGMLLVYRGEMFFAALPGTRMLHSENATMLKFQQETASLAKRIVADPHFVPGHSCVIAQGAEGTPQVAVPCAAQ